MKRSQLLETLREIARGKSTDLLFIRHGAKHDLYEINGVRLIIARHREINEITATATIKLAEGA